MYRNGQVWCAGAEAVQLAQPAEMAKSQKKKAKQSIQGCANFEARTRGGEIVREAQTVVSISARTTS